MRPVGTALILMLCTMPAFATERGMILCRSPVVANAYWNDLLSVSQAGVPIVDQIVLNVARKHGCQLVQSENLKPINFVAGTFGIADESGIRGFATPQSYILYVNRPQSN